MIADQFCLETEVLVHLMKHGARVPDIISADSIRHRYIHQAAEVDEDDERKPRRIVFTDGSIAQRDDHDKRIWRSANGTD